jgi:hypothetical protein
LTNHDNADITNSAASIAGIDPDDAPDTSLATAIRNLEQAEQGGLAWKLPDNIGDKLNIGEINDLLPDGAEATRAGTGSVYVETDRFQSVYSPDKLRQWLNADDDTDKVGDALWHVPTSTYSIVNPLTAYEPLEEAIRDEGYGGTIFGEIREYKGGGEVHMDVLFDAFQIDYNDDSDGSEPIVLGIESGYDFFGQQALYFQGFAQDRRCSNSIRSITEKKTIRHVGDVDLEDEVEDVLEEMELMTNRLAELIELAEDIEVDMLDTEFSEPFDHNDNIQAFYELSGFPSYMASAAASHARQRADNQFMPDMTALWDGATYALTHTYSGGENTTTEDALSSSSAHAEIEELESTVKEKADEFESRNEELRQSLLASAEGDGDD